jgi:hypothetical protein
MPQFPADRNAAVGWRADGQVARVARNPGPRGQRGGQGEGVRVVVVAPGGVVREGAASGQELRDYPPVGCASDLRGQCGTCD